MKSVLWKPLLVTPLVLCASLCSAEWEPTSWWVGTGLRHDSNAPRAERDEDKLGESFAQAEAGAGFTYRQNSALAYGLRTSVLAEQPFTYEALQQLESKLAPSVSWKTGLGPAAPRVSLSVPFGYRQFNAEIRSTAFIAPRLSVSRAMGERFRATVGIGGDRDWAESELFSTKGGEVFGELECSLSEELSVTARYSYRSGEIVSHAIPPRPDLARQADLRAANFQFDRRMIAYRFDAQTYLASLGMTYRFNHSTTVDASYTWRRTERGAFYYENALVGVAVRYAR